jgi:hypothetical protein
LEHTKYADGSARRWQMWFDGVWQRMSRWWKRMITREARRSRRSLAAANTKSP